LGERAMPAVMSWERLLSFATSYPSQNCKTTRTLDLSPVDPLLTIMHAAHIAQVVRDASGAELTFGECAPRLE